MVSCAASVKDDRIKKLIIVNTVLGNEKRMVLFLLLTAKLDNIFSFDKNMYYTIKGFYSRNLDWNLYFCGQNPPDVQREKQFFIIDDDRYGIIPGNRAVIPLLPERPYQPGPECEIIVFDGHRFFRYRVHQPRINDTIIYYPQYEQSENQCFINAAGRR